MAKEFLVEWRKKNDNDNDDDDGNIAQSEMAWCNNGFDDDDDEHWTKSKIHKNQNMHITHVCMHIYGERERRVKHYQTM